MTSESTGHPLPAEAFGQLVDAVTDFGLFLLDDDGMIQSWNPGAETMTGYAAKSAVGRPLSMLFHEDCRNSDFALDQITERSDREVVVVRSDRMSFNATVTLTKLGGHSNGYAVQLRKSGNPDVLPALPGGSCWSTPATPLLHGDSHVEHDRHEPERDEIWQFNRQIFDTATEGIILYDRDLHYVAWNPFLERMSGKLEAEVVGRLPWDVFPFLKNIDLEAQLRRVLAGDSFSMPDHFNPWGPNGGPQWLVANLSPLRNANGEIIGIINFLHDINRRKQTEEALRQSEDRLRTVLNSLQECVHCLDRDCVLLDMNPAGIAMIEAESVEQVLGHSVLGIVDEPYRAAFSALTEQVFRGETGVLEFSITGLKGTQRWLESHAGPFLDVHGNVVSLIGVTRDVTIRRRSEANLLETKASLRAFMDALPEPAFLIDIEGRVVVANQALGRSLEKSLADVVGQSVYQFLPPSIAHQRKSMIEQVVRSAKPLHFEDDDHGSHHINYLSPVIDAAGHVSRVAIHAVDITERKQLEEQLRQSQKMEAIGRLAGGVAHDFNNMLTVIIGHATLLLGDLPAMTCRRESAAAILHSGERAAGLTAQLLAFSRKAIIEPKVLDLNEGVDTVVRMLGRLIGEDIRILTDLAPDLRKVKIDPGQLEQLLINLAVNARDAMPRGGTLTIATKRVRQIVNTSAATGESSQGHEIELAISDTGEGMTEDVQRQIFEPFFTTKKVGHGTGLGLATVYGIVSQAGGSISVDSTLGQGTTFRVVLPAVEEKIKSGDTVTIRGAPRGTETILVAEDEGGVRRLTRLALEMQGYSVLEADCGKSAVDVAASHDGPIHLLVTDVVMPDFDGRTLSNMIRATRPETAVMYMSGYTDDAVVRIGIETSTGAFLQKPFTPLSIARKVREVLEAAAKPSEKP